MLSAFLDKKAMDMFTPVFQLTKNVMEEEEVYEILQSDLRPLNNLLLDIATLFQDQRKEDREILKIWLQLLHNCLTQADHLLHRYGPSQRQRRLDCLNCRPGRLLKRVKECQVHFDYIFQGLQTDFSTFVDQIVYRDPTLTPSSEESAQQLSEESEESAQQLSDFSMFVDQIVYRDPTLAPSAEESAQQLSEDEAAWMVFERIAFKEKGAPGVDIEGCARSIAEECKGFPLAIRLVAAAMRGKATIDEWNTALTSIKSALIRHPASSSYPHTVHPQLYQLLRWCYDALPNSHIKNCFLYCGMYPKDHTIGVQELVRMWISEGLVRSKQEKHSMDMAIGRRYVNLLLDRGFFRIVSRELFLFQYYNWALREEEYCIRVVDVNIHEMAIYIGEEEENCLLKAGQRLQNFPTIQNHADCKRISLLDNDDIQNLPSELPCPKLASFFLSCHSIEEVPSGFLVSLTSLKVLRLQNSSRINSIPSSVGQLKQLEFLSLQGLSQIKELPEQLCNLSFLQFLDLSGCGSLQSLPSKIGELQNLNYLNLGGCRGLKEIPHEISQLTSLSTLDLEGVQLRVGDAESEARRSIWRLKGLTNLRELRLNVARSPNRFTDILLFVDLRTRREQRRVAEGIMATWLEMRHLSLDLNGHADLLRGMKEMRKLQSFDLSSYSGSSLPDYVCNFRHLQNISLSDCPRLQNVSPLERLPNLKCLTLRHCDGLKALGIGNSGRASRFLMLEKLVLYRLPKLESIAGPSSNDSVWNESTLPSLRILQIVRCPELERFPVGMERLVNLTTIFGEPEWWDQIIWEDDAMKAHFQKLFQRCDINLF